MKNKKPLYQQVRSTVVPKGFNTGTRIHRPSKGKGSYKRNNKINYNTNIREVI